MSSFSNRRKMFVAFFLILIFNYLKLDFIINHIWHNQSFIKF